MTPIGTKVFELPNGSTVDISADLQSMLNTAVTSTPVFSPTDPGASDPCNAHLELRSAVTNFQMNVADVGITFGFNPAGSIPIGTGVSVTAAANVSIGTISMDFSVWSCVGGSCSAVAAVTADQLTSGVTLNATVDFSTITTGASFVYNTPLGNALRSIMNNAMSQLSASSRVNQLPWQALVREVTPATNTLVFDQGIQSGIGIDQGFESMLQSTRLRAGSVVFFKAWLMSIRL